MEPEDHSDGPIAEMVRWRHGLQGYWGMESLKRKQRSGTVNWVNMIHTHQRQSNVPRSLPSNIQTDKPSANSVEDKWKQFEGRTDENIIFSSQEAYVIFTSPPKSKGYMLRIQSQTHTYIYINALTHDGIRIRRVFGWLPLAIGFIANCSFK